MAASESNQAASWRSASGLEVRREFVVRLVAVRGSVDPTLSDEAAKDGAPEVMGLVKEGGRTGSDTPPCAVRLREDGAPEVSVAARGSVDPTLSDEAAKDGTRSVVP
jgi:hypothetical protein